MALIAALMMIVFASIAVLGVTTFIFQRLYQSTVIRMQTKAIYLAQAGLHNAIYFFRFHDRSANGYFTLGRTNIDAQNFFVLGGTDADLLMVNTSNARFVGRDLVDLHIQNATNSTTITIARMIVTFDGTRKLQNIRIGGSNRWNGNLSSPADCNINPDFVLNTTPTIYSINRLRFSTSGTLPTRVSIQFVMSDGSNRTLTLYPSSQNYNFTVTSTGKTTTSNFYRTIQVDYNALTSRIINYNETNIQITP
jgi:hypothetical protein